MNMILESLTCIEYVIMYPLPNNIIYKCCYYTEARVDVENCCEELT